ncbi:lysozyme inhibitor LprI family protein [uncultured Thiodictyon sp.]|uniref:lysozyme inhibitor LprI family protein n=1 Tax=uncultured Thiodictyon sp. TaxID=1846217 RepID=UPI0025FFC167|nr:lysozyme inhibitor LprI family protein [uncultured Thiodictyon sp.]
MRALLLCAVLLLAPTATLVAQTQFEMNQGSSEEYQSADRKLTTAYQRILRKYAKNPVFLKNLKSAQRRWIQWRDAELAMKFPERETGFYGSMLPMCQAGYLTELTVTRTKQLEAWLKPSAEGDGCAGSLGDFVQE